MDALRVGIAALALLAAVPAEAYQVDRWRPHIAEASDRFGVPVEWIERVMRAESGGRTALNGRPITSHAGAMGLMQLMPGTWAEMRARLGLGADPHDPRDNVMAGVAYLRLMYDRFGYPGLFAAYNAGPGRYAQHLSTGRTLPGETRAYLVNVAGTETTARRAMTPPASGGQTAPERTANTVFFALRPEAVPTAEGTFSAQPDRLFVIRRAAPNGEE